MTDHAMLISLSLHSSTSEAQTALQGAAVEIGFKLEETRKGGERWPDTPGLKGQKGFLRLRDESFLNIHCDC